VASRSYWRDAYDAALAAKLYNGSGPDYAEPVEAPTAEAGGSGSNDPQPEPSTNSDETATNAPEPEVVATQPPPQPTQPQPEDATAPVDLWDTFAPPALPVGVLPPLIDDWAFEQGALMGADPAGLAMAALTICAAAITDQIKLKPKQHAEWKVTTCLWTGLLGGVSAKKTPIISEASWPIRKLDMEMRRSNNLASAQYDALTKEQKQSTPPPKRPRLVLEDVTIEAAQEVFRDSPDGLLCLRDELGGWFGSMDKYSGHRGASADRAFWLQAYNGGPYSYDRVTRSSGIIENLSACVLGGIQPEPMRKIAEGTVDDGLIQRLCPIMVRPGTAGQDARPAASTPRYAELIKRLHTIREPFDTIIFDDEARALRQTLAEKHQNLMACEAVNRKLGAHIGKFDGIFARLCLLWHCVDHCSTNNWQTELSILVSAATAQRVEQFLHGFLLPHAAAFYFDVFGLSDDHERLTAVAGYILAHRLEVVTNRDVQHGIRMMRKLDRQDVTSVFYQLYALGWLLPPVGPATRDTLRWMVNPTVHRLFEARAAQERARRQQAREILVTLRAR